MGIYRDSNFVKMHYFHILTGLIGFGLRFSDKKRIFSVFFHLMFHILVIYCRMDRWGFIETRTL